MWLILFIDVDDDDDSFPEAQTFIYQDPLPEIK